MTKRCRHKWETLSKRVQNNVIVHEICRCTKCDTYRVEHGLDELVLCDAQNRPMAVLDLSLLR